MSSSRYARVAFAFGLLAIAAIPASVAASELSKGLGLLFATGIAVPVAVGLALIGLGFSRRATLRFERSVRRAGARTVRAARLLVWVGLYLGVTGALALGFYGALRARS